MLRLVFDSAHAVYRITSSRQVVVPTFTWSKNPRTSKRRTSKRRVPRLVYDDTAHVLGTVGTPVEPVIGGVAGTFLWPAEQAPERRARAPIEGFVHWMAVHHVAANIWPDLCEDPPSAIADERGRKLLEALVIQGEHTVVREVTLYWQRREGTVALPPV
ncbi:hypothetical protein EDB85DRAFT_2158122 [Lactarius pseudohatsudake]|nr:hypothetical protein EDB85DRAFT_2158122 [Lactarius pseudohatsudake]